MLPETQTTATSAEPVTAAGRGGNDGSYLESSATDVAFVRWTDSHGALSGTFDYVTVDSSTPTGTNTEEQSVAGLRNGDHVSLTLNQGLGSLKTLTGALSGSGSRQVLTLTFPQVDGQLADAAFVTASVDEYNAAVAALAGQGQAQNQADATASAQASAAASQAAVDERLGRADSSLGADLATLGQDLAALNGDDFSFSKSLTVTADALAQTRRDLTVEERDAGASSPDCGTVGSDDGTVNSDEGAVASGQGAVESDTASVANDADAVTRDVGQTNDALASLQQLEELDPRVQARNSAADVAPLASQARSLLAAAQRGEDQAATAAQKDVDAAQALAAKADQLSSSCTT